MVNVPHDRDGGVTTDAEGTQKRTVIPGESLADTATRVAKIIDTPPEPVVFVPLEERDPDAPEGWYDEPDVSGAWAAFAVQQGLAELA